MPNLITCSISRPSHQVCRLTWVPLVARHNRRNPLKPLVKGSLPVLGGGETLGTFPFYPHIYPNFFLHGMEVLECHEIREGWREPGSGLSVSTLLGVIRQVTSGSEGGWMAMTVPNISVALSQVAVPRHACPETHPAISHPISRPHHHITLYVTLIGMAILLARPSFCLPTSLSILFTNTRHEAWKGGRLTGRAISAVAPMLLAVRLALCACPPR